MGCSGIYQYFIRMTENKRPSFRHYGKLLLRVFQLRLEEYHFCTILPPKTRSVQLWHSSQRKGKGRLCAGILVKKKVHEHKGDSVQSYTHAGEASTLYVPFMQCKATESMP